MKASLHFSLPEDQGKFDAALLGRDALSALCEIENHCRAIVSHGDPREDMRQLCETIRAMIPPERLVV